MRSNSASNKEFLICISGIPCTKCGPIVLSLPLAGLGFGIIYSILFDFAASNRTHCQVWNFLPSISAATGTFEPQISVWWWCIVLHTPARYFVCVCYMTYYSTVSSISWRQSNSCLIIGSIMLNMVEVTALLLLTLVSSSSDFGIHKSSFLTFILTSLLYMIATISLQSSLVVDTKNRVLHKSVGYKKLFFFFNVMALSIAGCMYWIHNTYCKPGVYSLFSLSEYIVVITNIAFHGTALLEFTAIPVSMDQSSYYTEV